MLNPYIAWWAQQMRQWVPELLARDRFGGDALVIEADADLTVVGLTLRRRRGSRPLARFRLDRTSADVMRAAVPTRPSATILRLPPGLLLERKIALPLAAERELDRLLAYEMDRNTPFTAAEVFWSCVVERRDRTQGKLLVTLSVLSKEVLEPLLAPLAAAGVAPTAIEGVSVGGTQCRIDLRRLRLSRAAKSGLVAGGALCAALGIAVVALPFVMQTLAARRVEAGIAQLLPEVTEAEGLRRQMASAAAAVDVIAAERSRDGNALEVLAAVTDVLPDDTFLSELALHQGKLTLNGQSASAARLIAALATDPTIRNPEFAAPVTRIDKERADLFTIRAGLAR